MDVRVGDVLELLGGEAHHFVGNIHAVDIGEESAGGAEEAARAAADLERAAARGGGETLDLGLHEPHQVGCGGEELGPHFVLDGE